MPEAAPAPKKPKLTFDEMIVHLERKNIKFGKISREEAKSLLQNSNYLYKMTAYRKNFEKDQGGKYIHLDFILLRDLSTLDMRLRYLVLQMCLDIEHSLKTKILADITNDPNEDGYEIVKDYFKFQKSSIDELVDPLKSKTNYNHGLYKKYKENWPVWAFFEIIRFNGLVQFTEFYHKRRGKFSSYHDIYPTLRYVKNIRNLAAHNSPLLMDITKRSQIEATKISRQITTFVKNVTNLSAGSRNKRLTNRRVHDLTALLYVYDSLILSKEMKRFRYDGWVELLERSKRHKDIYIIHPALIAVYKYFKDIVDFLTKND